MAEEYIIRFIHISDTHIGPDPDFELYDKNPYACGEELVEAIGALPFRPDFVLHTGDIVADPDPESYQLAARLFARMELPVYYVSGNHDSSQDIQKYLAMGKKRDLGDDNSKVFYEIDTGPVKVVCLDANCAEINPMGRLPKEQLDILRSELRESFKPIIVSIHFPALPLDSRWLDRTMLLENGEELHELLSAHRDKVDGVLFGHIHRGMQIYRDGILYSSVGSNFCGFSSWPDDEDVIKKPDTPKYYNVVTVTRDTVLIKQHVVEESWTWFV